MILNKLTASTISLIYLVVAGLWIILTDSVLEFYISDTQLLSRFQTYKGTFYVLATTAGLYFLIKWHDKQLRDERREFRSKHELLEKLFERIPVMITRYNPELEEFKVNKEFEEVTGWNSEEIKEIDLVKACYPDPQYRKEVLDFMTTPGTGWREFVLTKKSSEQIDTLWTNIRLTDNTQVGIGMDITERKEFEQTQLLQKRKLEQIQDIAEIGYWEQNLKTGETTWSDSLYRMHGLDREVVEADPELFLNHVHPEDRLLFENFEERLIEQGSQKYAFRFEKPDGELGYYYTKSEVIYDNEGAPEKLIGTVTDITELKKTESELEKSQQLLRKTFESLRSAICIIDPDTRTIIDCNKQAEVIFGYTKEELIGSSTQMLHVDEERFKKFNALGRQALQDEGVFSTQYKMQRKNGEAFHSDHTVTLVHDDEGNLDRVVSVVRDITEQKKYEENLRESRERLSRAQKVGKLGDWEYNPHTGEISWSPMMYEIFERDPDLGTPSYEELLSTYYKEGRELISQSVKKALNKGQPYDIDFLIHTDQDNTKYIRTIGIPISDDSGNIVKLMGTVQDITEHKRAEQKLQESEEKYRLLFEDNPQPMWIYNPDTFEFVEVNKAAISHYGYSEQEFKNMTIKDIRPEEDIPTLEENVRKNWGSLKYGEEWRHLKKDGGQITVSISAAPIEFENNNYRIVVAKDITDQKRAEKQVLNSLIEGEERERTRIAKELHDGLGQYLSASNMNLEAIKNDIDELPPKRVKQFQTALNLLQNAIEETRSIAHNLMPTAIEDYGLNLAVQALVEDLEKGCNITFSFESNLEEVELTHQAEINLYRIIQEALSNGIKYADCSKISLQLYKHDHILSCTIEDDGSGVEIDTTLENQGMGIRSIKSRVNALSGNIEFTSKPGSGLTILIELPLEQNTKG